MLVLIWVLGGLIAAAGGYAIYRYRAKELRYLEVYHACMKRCGDGDCDAKCRREAREKVGSLWSPW
jgi:hypothetical protein